MQIIQEYLTLSIELIFSTFLLVVTFDLLNRACYVNGYQIPNNWKPPAIIPTTDAQVEAAPPLPEVEIAPKAVLSLIAPPSNQHAEEVIATPVKPLSLGKVQLPDPWTLPVNEVMTQPRFLSSSAKTAQAMLLLPPARQPQLDLAALKLYKLGSHSVVRVEVLPGAVPSGLKRYHLHGFSVVRLAELEAAIA